MCRFFALLQLLKRTGVFVNYYLDYVYASAIRLLLVVVLVVAVLSLFFIPQPASQPASQRVCRFCLLDTSRGIRRNNPQTVIHAHGWSDYNYFLTSMQSKGKWKICFQPVAVYGPPFPESALSVKDKRGSKTERGNLTKPPEKPS